LVEGFIVAGLVEDFMAVDFTVADTAKKFLGFDNAGGGGTKLFPLLFCGLIATARAPVQKFYSVASPILVMSSWCRTSMTLTIT